MQQMQNKVRPDTARVTIPKDYDRKPFNFGYANYPPFISCNGDVKGVFFDAMQILGKEFGGTIHTQKCDWGNFSKKIKEGCISTMAVPIVPSYNRPLQIIPYLVIQSCIILSSRDTAHTSSIKRIVNKISDILHEWIPVKSLSELSDLINQITYIINDLSSIGNGVACTDGVYEHDTLKFFNVHIERPLPYDNIVENAITALKDKFIILLDQPSAQMVENKLKGQCFTSPLAGEHFPIKTFAGLPLAAIADDDIVQYFSYHCTSKEGIIQEAINKIPLKKLVELSIDTVSFNTDYLKHMGFFTKFPILDWFKENQLNKDEFGYITEICSFKESNVIKEPNVVPIYQKMPQKEKSERFKRSESIPNRKMGLSKTVDEAVDFHGRISINRESILKNVKYILNARETELREHIGKWVIIASRPLPHIVCYSESRNKAIDEAIAKKYSENDIISYLVSDEFLEGFEIL